MKSLLLLAALGALAAVAPAADFSYYMLSLSYAPEYCFHSSSKDPRECGPGRKTFVVHGLWPQNNTGRGPENCGPARPVAAEIVRLMLSYMPTESLIQHEWATHGTCSGLSPAAYFAAVRQARDSVQIPQRLIEMPRPIALPPEELEAEFGIANPGLARSGIRTACYADGGLEDIRICFDKNLKATACTGASECTRGAVRLSAQRTMR